MTLARRSRAQLCDAFEEFGPLAPTLAGDWKTQDLAAHVWIREHRPSAAVGILVQRFAERTQRLQTEALHTMGYEEIVRQLRTPALLFRPVDRFVNGAELAIHLLDVLKPQDRQADFSEDDQRQLWKLAGMLARRAKVDARLNLQWGSRAVARGRGDHTVHLVGAPSELVYFLSGRTHDADVELVGEPEIVEQLTGSVPPM